MKDFTGKIAVITGGGTGMGRELARALAGAAASSSASARQQHYRALA